MVATFKGPTAGEFRATLHWRFYRAEREGAKQVEVTSGDLHREAGGDPGDSGGVRSCCLVMRGEMLINVDSVVSRSGGGDGASLTIRYKVPRWPQ
jgi:hypothetical protein